MSAPQLYMRPKGEKRYSGIILQKEKYINDKC
jgi:hypothetical protein